MAKEDPESSLAEDRAWDVWSNDDSSGEARQFFRLEDREDVWEHIFRQGFRAGREHGRQSPPVLGTYANHARRLTELEGLLPRIDALEQTVKANDEKRHFGEGELRGYNQELERAVARIESRLRPEILVTPLAKPLDPEEKLERHGFRDRGDGWHERLVIAPTPDYRIAEPTEAPEPCSCDESLALREEVRLLRAELGSASLELKQMAGRVEEAEQYAAACEKTAALNQKENVRLKTELVESKAVRKTLEQRVCSQRLVGAAMHKQLAAANALLAQLRATAAEAYGLPNRAALREHAWRYLDFMRDVLAKGPAEQGEAPATPARSEEQEKSCPYAACRLTGKCIYPERAISLGCPDEFTAPSLGQPGAEAVSEALATIR